MLVLISCGADEINGPVLGVRLGESPSQVRQHLRTGAPGSFRSITEGEDFALEWSPRSPNAALRHARFEFHLGLLVALRLTLAPDAPEAHGPQRQLSSASVVARRSTPGSRADVELTWIARGCPTHAAEFRRLAEPHQ